VSDAFAAAIEYHRSHETRWRRDFLTDDGRYIGVADEPAAVGDVLDLTAAPDHAVGANPSAAT